MTGDGHASAGTPGSRNVVPPGVWVDETDEDDPVLRNADGSLVDTWREDYPYDERLDRDDYEEEKRQLQVELLKLQYWTQDTGHRIVILFEGRDAAGKGGTIKRFMEHLNPRAARVVALDKPTESERGQWYFQRYVAHLPTAGEIVLFDRSWYNRAGVERVMGFCTDEEYEIFLRQAPVFEQMLVDDGISLTKFWFSVTPGEQRTRFAIRQIDPVRQWKLSPTDIALLSKWDAYTAAKDAMFEHTDTDVRAVDRDQEQRQEARPARRHAQPAQRDRLRPQGPGRRRAAGSADRRRPRGHAGNGSGPAVPHAARQDPAGTPGPGWRRWGRPAPG